MADTVGCPFSSSCTLDFPHTPSECHEPPEEEFVNAGDRLPPEEPKTRQLGERELNVLRDSLGGARLPAAAIDLDDLGGTEKAHPGYLKLIVSRNVETLGDVAEVLRGLQGAGVGYESLMYVVARVYGDAWPTWQEQPVRQ